ncbi:cell envelope integrity EipB family protein [Nitratireductor indicus]|uniref:cell envelope integrity EipB family protein n=1 Tax=Nitratireductor indicus TaxID=721133 RepID=UPI00287481EA|nr:cell envelope integrity EipB family protein [Nitratireductor indicus]MDS1135346.1 cell envelope integrity EipB family protein [Nitratireductor indicus]
MRVLRLSFLSLAALCGPFGSLSFAGPGLLAHRAVYDLSLGDASDRSGINGISGRMVYEFTGSACEGYSTTFRFVMRIETDEATRLSDQQTTTFEDAKGETFQFVNKTYLDNTLDREVRGVARTGKDGTDVDVSKPEKRSFKLEPTQFPVTHMKEAIAKAKDGGGFYQTTLYDSSEDADRVMLTAVTIGKARGVAKDDPEREAAAVLKDGTYWPVTIAYFDPTKDRGEETPEYDISFLMHESGVTRDLKMNYGEFSINGKLVDLTLFDQKDGVSCTE